MPSTRTLRQREAIVLRFRMRNYRPFSDGHGPDRDAAGEKRWEMAFKGDRDIATRSTGHVP